MENNITYTTFFNKVKESISNGTFAKLTLAKTVGKPELQNIYVRTTVEDNVLKLALTFKIYNNGLQELVKVCEIDDMEKELICRALLKNRGNQRKSADQLGLPKSTLNDRIKSYRINIEELISSCFTN